VPDRFQPGGEPAIVIAPSRLTDAAKYWHQLCGRSSTLSSFSNGLQGIAGAVYGIADCVVIHNECDRPAFAGAQTYPHLGGEIQFITPIVGSLGTVKTGHHPKVTGKNIPKTLYVEYGKIMSH
jgi:hypothetical protein